MTILRPVLPVILSFVLAGCVASPDFDNDPSAENAVAFHDSFDGHWRMQIASEPKQRLFQHFTLNCGAIKHTGYLYIAGGRVLNFTSREQPGTVGLDGQFRFDVPTDVPLYRISGGGDESIREEQEWLRFEGKLVERSGDGKFTLASSRHGGAGCWAKIEINRINTPNPSARKIKQPVATDRESLLLDYSAMSSNCKPMDVRLDVTIKPRGGSLRISPSSDTDTRNDRVRIKLGERCRSVAVKERQQVFYEPDPGFTGMDTFTVAAIRGDGLKPKVQKFEIRVGDTQ